MTAGQIIRVTDDTTRADLITALTNVNKTAMAIRRRGYVGIHSPEYARRHANIDALLDELVHASP